jgi:hypothetical protein
MNNRNQQIQRLLPYYRHGKARYKQQPFHHKTTFQYIQNEPSIPIENEDEESVWILPNPIQTPTRNHESILLEYTTVDHSDQQMLVNILGRYSRVVQWMDLLTGEQNQVQTVGNDPDGRPLNDLNHVASVLVDVVSDDSTSTTKYKRKEVWLPCGFHNDRIGKEQSSNYVRIVDLETMTVRAGPKLPYSGGACGAALIDIMPNNSNSNNYPPLICAFGGTDGNHDTGTSARGCSMGSSSLPLYLLFHKKFCLPKEYSYRTYHVTTGLRKNGCTHSVNSQLGWTI